MLLKVVKREIEMKKKLTPLEKAIKIIGSNARLAKLLGLTPWAVRKWDRDIPQQKRCLVIQRLTNNKVTAEELRPDINWDFVRKQLKDKKSAWHKFYHS